MTGPRHPGPVPPPNTIRQTGRTPTCSDLYPSRNAPPILGQQKVSQDRGVTGQVTGVLGHVTGDKVLVVPGHPCPGTFTQMSQDT